MQPKKWYPILAGLFPAKVGDDKTVAEQSGAHPSRSGSALLTASSFAPGFDSHFFFAAS